MGGGGDLARVEPGPVFLNAGALHRLAGTALDPLTSKPVPDEVHISFFVPLLSDDYKDTC